MIARRHSSPSPPILIIAPRGQAEWARIFLREMRDALSALGRKVVWMAVESDADDERIARKLTQWRDVGQSFDCFSINANVKGIGRRHGWPLRTHFTWMVDHPIHHLGKIVENDARTVCGYVDALFVTDHQQLRPDIEAVFMPHCGRLPDAPPEPMAARSDAILYAANFWPEGSKEGFLHALRQLPPPWPRIVAEASEAVLLERRIPWDAVRHIAASHGIDAAETGNWDALRDGLGVLEHRLLSVQRLEILQRLSGISMTVVGRLPDYLLDAYRIDPEHFAHLGTVAYSKIQQLMDSHRITINTSVHMHAGAHERIWSAIGAGSVVLSNRTLFLDQLFEDEKNILFFKSDENFFNRFLKEALEDPEKLSAMADSATALMTGEHEFSSRARMVVDCLDG